MSSVEKKSLIYFLGDLTAASLWKLGSKLTCLEVGLLHFLLLKDRVDEPDSLWGRLRVCCCQIVQDIFFSRFS